MNFAKQQVFLNHFFIREVGNPRPEGRRGCQEVLPRGVGWLRAIFAKVYTDFKAQLVEMDGEDDHVHLLVEYPPKSRQH